MDGDKSGESRGFPFSEASQISAIVGDHSRQMKLTFFRRGRGAMDFAHLPISYLLSSSPLS